MASLPLNSSVLGEWPMAMNTPSVGSVLSAPVLTLRSRTALTSGAGAVSPMISSSTVSQSTVTLGFLNSRSCRIFSARKRVAAMDQRHLRGVVREVERLLDRGVAAADHDHFLAAEEEAVAGRAGRNAAAAEGLLGRQAEPFRRGAGRDDQCVRLIAVAGIADADERPARQVDLDDGVEEQLRADMLGLLLHLLHQPGALDDVGEARIVLDIGGDGELAARLDALHQHGLQAGAGGIDRRRVAGRARAQDQNLAAMSCCHDLLASRLPHIADIYANLAADARAF